MIPISRIYPVEVLAGDPRLTSSRDNDAWLDASEPFQKPFYRSIQIRRRRGNVGIVGRIDRRQPAVIRLGSLLCLRVCPTVANRQFQPPLLPSPQYPSQQPYEQTQWGSIGSLLILIPWSHLGIWGSWASACGKSMKCSSNSSALPLSPRHRGEVPQWFQGVPSPANNRQRESRSLLG